MLRYTKEAADMIRANYTYDANRGYILSKYARGNRPAGAIVPVSDYAAGRYGFVSIKLKSKYYQAGAVAWLLAYGTWPDYRIEPSDGIRRYIKLNTLYESNNPTTYTPEERGIRNGVHIAEAPIFGPFVAYYHGRRLGDFDTVAEASAAWFEEDAAWIG